jgi:flavin-dependent dehydrogenase
MTTDVVVVGAGPAGSSVALRLCRAGVGVVLLERKRFPRDKVCGEYLSPGALAALSELGVDRRVALLGHPIRRVALSAFGHGPVIMALPAGGALALSRADLDSLLRDTAIAAGAEPLDGIFRELRDEGAGWRVSYRDAAGAERYCTARAVVGADGAWSSVARSAGLAGDARRAGRWAVGGHVRSNAADSDTLEMFVGVGGYYARNPLGGEYCNSMLVMPKPVADDARADAIVDEVTGGRYRFEGASLVKRVAVGPLRYAPHSVAAPGVVLTGDAAGMLDPFVGQGVAVALESSVACAAGVMAHLAGDPARETVRAIRAARRQIERPRRMLAAAVDLIVRTPLLRALALRRARRDVAAAEMVLAAVAGAVPCAQTISPAALVRLLA